MKQRNKLLGALVAGGLAIAASAAVAQDKPKFWNLAGGGSAGSWYVGGAIISEIVNSNLKNVRLTPQPGGGVVNMRSLQSGKADFAFMFTSTSAQALAGEGPFNGKPLNKVRAIMGLSPMYVHLVVRADGPIKTYGDIASRKISPGKRGFTGAETFLQLIREHGMSVESIESKGGRVLWLDYADATENMRDGLVDGLFSTSAVPHSSYTELASAFPIRIVPVERKIMEGFAKKTPGWDVGTIPPNSYPGQIEAVPTLVDAMGLATHADLADEDAYQFTKLVWEHRKRLIDGYPAYKDLTAEVALNQAVKSLPMHPGATRYWAEAGLLK